jgi:hypothetical protein
LICKPMQRASNRNCLHSSRATEYRFAEALSSWARPILHSGALGGGKDVSLDRAVTAVPARARSFFSLFLLYSFYVGFSSSFFLISFFPFVPSFVALMLLYFSFCPFLFFTYFSFSFFIFALLFFYFVFI